MSVAFLDESPLTPPSGLGQYRAADYFSLPDEPRCELLNGRFYVTPSPFPAHQLISAILTHGFYEIARRTGGRVFAAPLDVRLAEHSVVQPDLTYLPPERLDRIGGKFLFGAPDLVVEILSLSTARRDRGEKLALYAKAGVREYWLVDPVVRQIDFLVNERGESGRFVVVPLEGPLYRSPEIPEITLDVEAFWAEVAEKAT